MTELDEGLTNYLIARWQGRDRRVDALLGQLTTRERALVREIAVMTSVRATMRAGSRETVPPDTEVLRDAVDACLSMPDLYPTVARLDRRAARKAAQLAEVTS